MVLADGAGHRTNPVPGGELCVFLPAEFRMRLLVFADEEHQSFANTASGAFRIHLTGRVGRCGLVMSRTSRVPRYGE